MRALHVSAGYWPFIGGAEAYLQRLSERLVEAGHSVTVLTTDAARAEYLLSPRGERVDKRSEIHNGVSILRFPVRHLPFSPYSYQILRRSAMEISRLPIDVTSLPLRWGRYMPWVPSLEMALGEWREKFHLVHGVNLSYESLPLTALCHAEKIGAPFLFTPFLHVGERGRGPVYRYCTMAHQLELFRRSTKIIVQTDRERDALVGIGIEGRKIEKVGMAVDLGEIQGGDGRRFKEKYNIDNPLVAFIGRVSHDKGAVHLVEAMRQLWDRGREVDLVLAGPLMGRFARYYRSLPSNVQRRVRLLGPIRREKRDLLDAAEMLVLPSRVDSFGLVFLEAWAYQKPVIGAAAGGIPEVVSEGSDGFLVPFGDVKGLAHRIATLLDDRTLAQRMGEQGYRKVTRFYTWDVIFPRLEEIYLRLVG